MPTGSNSNPVLQYPQGITIVKNFIDYRCIFLPQNSHQTVGKEHMFSEKKETSNSRRKPLLSIILETQLFFLRFKKNSRPHVAFSDRFRRPHENAKNTNTAECAYVFTVPFYLIDLHALSEYTLFQ